MFTSIRSKLLLAVAIMTALLGALIYFTSLQMDVVEQTLSDLESLQDVKSHVLIPQKDMNQFIAAMDSTVLFLELGDAEAAQAAYDGSVDAEQDISAEFEYLEKNAPEAVKLDIAQAHLGWEVATEFLKMKAEVLADEKGLALTRPAADIKVVDAHSDSAVDAAKQTYEGLSYEKLEAIHDNDETNPVEIADEGIDTSEEKVDEYLEAERVAGQDAVASSSTTVLFGSLGVLVAIVLVGAVVTSTVSRPLTMLKAGAEKIAEGDLDYAFKNISEDEVGSVIDSVQVMAHSLKDRIRNLEEVAGIVMLTGEEIGVAAERAKDEGANVDSIIAKADQLKALVGQMMDSGK